MSTINVTNLSGRGGATPNLPDGANITGVATATTFDGSLKSTGTPTLGLGVTINSSGLHITGVTTVGVVTGGTFYGDGSNLTGVGETTAPWHYNPSVGDTEVTIDTGIGITFNKKIDSGSGTATLKIVNAGAAGTTIQSWGISSATFNVTEFSLGALVSNLTINQTYQLDIPDGFIVDNNETSYAGTAYTFTVEGAESKFFSWGDNENGRLGLNGPDQIDKSSPTQIPGETWSANTLKQDWYHDARSTSMIQTDGTLWSFGVGSDGQLGQGSTTERSSPTQIGSETTWASTFVGDDGIAGGIKTDGTLWTWGQNGYGALGHNNRTQYSSPKQVPGTTWATGDYKITGGVQSLVITKTNGTLWAMGNGEDGRLGLNNQTRYSSPVQIPGTTWSKTFSGHITTYGIKTDGTLWAWGANDYGQLGQNAQSPTPTGGMSSPVQIPGTTWFEGSGGYNSVLATKTDNTLWAWGENEYGCLGLNQHDAHRSSPTQVPGSWSKVSAGRDQTYGVKTDGTLWAWGADDDGELGQNSNTSYSSPVQVGSDTIWTGIQAGTNRVFALLNDQTP